MGLKLKGGRDGDQVILNMMDFAFEDGDGWATDLSTVAASEGVQFIGAVDDFQVQAHNPHPTEPILVLAKVGTAPGSTLDYGNPGQIAVVLPRDTRKFVFPKTWAVAFVLDSTSTNSFTGMFRYSGSEVGAAPVL